MEAIKLVIPAEEHYKVLIACEPGNPASRRTILANGGVYENTVYDPVDGIDLERYWITL